MQGFKGMLDDAVREPSITEMVPPSGLFHGYVARAQRLTDAPSIYHLVSCISTFASVVSPHARLLFRNGGLVRREPVHLWSLMCGRSNNRKSHALDMAKAMFEPYIEDRLCPESGTREGFEEFMIAQPNAYLAIREAPTWISDNRTVWMRNGAAWWCKVFDGRLEPKLHAARASDDEDRKLSYPVCVSICAAGETTAVIDASRPTDWTGGMFSRMLIVSAGKRKEQDEWFDWPERDVARVRAEMDAVLALCRRSPDVVISRDAWATYKRWNGPIQESAERLSAAKSTILGRLGRHVKVIAALYALGSLRNEVGTEHMEAAVALGRKSHKSVLELTI